MKERLAAGDEVDPVREITRATPLTRALQEGDEDIVEADFEVVDSDEDE